MLISELIKELQERLDLYGDSAFVFRSWGTDDDCDVLSAYYDQDDEKMIVSDDPCLF